MFLCQLALAAPHLCALPCHTEELLHFCLSQLPPPPLSTAPPNGMKHGELKRTFSKCAPSVQLPQSLCWWLGGMLADFCLQKYLPKGFPCICPHTVLIQNTGRFVKKAKTEGCSEAWGQVTHAGKFRTESKSVPGYFFNYKPVLLQTFSKGQHRVMEQLQGELLNALYHRISDLHYCLKKHTEENWNSTAQESTSSWRIWQQTGIHCSALKITKLQQTVSAVQDDPKERNSG